METQFNENEIKGHQAGLHGSGQRIFLVVDTNDLGYSHIAFEKESDARNMLQTREAAGWTSFVIRESLFFKDALIEPGPTVVEKRPNCKLCQDMIQQPINEVPVQ